MHRFPIRKQLANIINPMFRFTFNIDISDRSVLITDIVVLVQVCFVSGILRNPSLFLQLSKFWSIKAILWCQSVYRSIWLRYSHSNHGPWKTLSILRPCLTLCLRTFPCPHTYSHSLGIGSKTSSQSVCKSNLATHWNLSVLCSGIHTEISLPHQSISLLLCIHLKPLLAV